MSELFSVHVATSGDQVVVALIGELDLSGVEELDAALGDVPDSVGDLIIDLARLSFMDSSGLGAIVRAKQKADAVGRQLRVRGAVGSVRKLLDIVALGETVDLID